MIRYMAAAVGLRAFSLNSATRKAYRKIGNSLGERKRSKRPNIANYIKRGDLLVELAKKYGLLSRDISAVELGTGWMHWFGLYLSLHAEEDIQLEFFDVWDNRQLGALKALFGELSRQWEGNDDISAAQRERMEKLLNAPSLDDLYAAFNARYTIADDGSLSCYGDASQDLVFSFHVMEHIHRDYYHDSIGHMYRMLKPGGYCIHQIGIDDHLTHYDKKESQKNYLQYSMAMRKRLFENVVQYHNVLQASDYLKSIEQHGFEVVESDREKIDISGLNVNSDWSGYSAEDLETTILTLVLRKPG